MQQQTALYRLISLRVAPPLVLLYFVSFLDRVNISFAALTMDRDLGIGDDLFGIAAGVFFLGYLLFAVPSNLMLTHFGARRWIAVLMVTWGLLSGCMALVHGPVLYIALRFLIGAAEAGFFPGVILYLTQWLPGTARAGIMALFTFAIPLSNMIGAPISASILRLGGYRGLAGWQWLFLLEALPAVLLGCAVPWMLQPDPRRVRWLSDAQKASLLQAIDSESAHTPASSAASIPSIKSWPLRPLLSGAAIYFTMMVGLYALGFWIPRLLASHGVGMRSLGWLTAVPFAAGAVGMLLWSALSDRARERRLNLAIALLVAGLGMAVAGFATATPVVIAGLSLTAVGIFAAMAIFWAAFSQNISPAQAAVSIALVNSVGNIGGFVSPTAIGWLLKHTHTYAAGLSGVAICLGLGAVLVFFTMRSKTPVPAGFTA